MKAIIALLLLLSLDARAFLSGGGLPTPAMQSINTSTTTTGNLAATETDLFSHSLTGSTLSANGNTIRFHAAGSFATSLAVDKRLRVKFGATTILDTGVLAVTTLAFWVLEGECVRTGATTQKCYASISTSYASLSSYAQYTTAAETLSGAVIVKVTGQGTNANDVVGEMFKVSLLQ